MFVITTDIIMSRRREAFGLRRGGTVLGTPRGLLAPRRRIAYNK